MGADVHPHASDPAAPPEFRFATGDFGGRPGWRGVRVGLRDGHMTLDGRGLLLRRPTVTIALSEVLNVGVEGKQVRFERASAAPKERLVVLRAKTAPEAQRLAAALPATQSPEFAAEAARHNQFVAAYKGATRWLIVTPLMAAACVAVYVSMGLRGADWMDPSVTTLLDWGGNHWAMTTAGEWWRLVTAGFLHGGLIHLAMNMQALLVCGSVTERLFGNRLFGLVYAFGLIASSLASIWFEHTAVVVGASGAIFAVYGALLAYVIRRRGTLSKQVVQRLGTSTAVFIGYNLIFGLSHAGISNAAHVGGLVSGFALGLLVSPPLEKGARDAAIRRGLTIGGVASVAAAALLVVLMPRSWLDIKADALLARERDRLVAGEKQMDADYRAALVAFDKKELDPAACAARIDEQVIPQWDRACAGVQSITLPTTSSEYPQLTVLKEIYRLKREWIQQASEAIRGYSDEPAKVTEFNERWKRVQEQTSVLASKSQELKRLDDAKVKRLQAGK